MLQGEDDYRRNVVSLLRSQFEHLLMSNPLAFLQQHNQESAIIVSNDSYISCTEAAVFDLNTTPYKIQLLVTASKIIVNLAVIFILQLITLTFLYIRILYPVCDRDRVFIGF